MPPSENDDPRTGQPLVPTDPPIAAGVDGGPRPRRSMAAAPDQPPAAPLYNPRVRISVVYPNGQKRSYRVAYAGWMGPNQIESWERTLLHALRAPVGAHVETILLVNRIGRNAERQPALFTRRNDARRQLVNEHRKAGAPAVRGMRTAVPLDDDLRELVETEGPGVAHPGVRAWRPDPPSVGVMYDEPDPAQVARDEALANEANPVEVTNGKTPEEMAAVSSGARNRKR